MPSLWADVCGTALARLFPDGVQFALSVTAPFATDVRLRNQTSPDAPLTHFVVELVSGVEGEDVLPHFAVLVFSPLVTVHPVNVFPLFIGAETRKAVLNVAGDGWFAPAVPPSSV